MQYATINASGQLTGFYDDDAGTPPTGAIRLTPSQYQEWLTGQSSLIWVGNALTAAPPPPPPTLAQQAVAALAAGCAVVSASTPVLSATYGCDAVTQTDVLAEMVSLLLSGNFTNGSTTLQFADQAGTMHSFTVAEFKNFAPALGQYVGALKALAVTNSGTLPAQPVTIA